jgi:hypothetical protein
MPYLVQIAELGEPVRGLFSNRETVQLIVHVDRDLGWVAVERVVRHIFPGWEVHWRSDRDCFDYFSIRITLMRPLPTRSLTRVQG